MAYKDFDNTYNKDFVYDADVVKNSIDRLLKTPKGALLDNPEYGCDVASYIYEPLVDSTRFALQVEITTAIDRFEKRATLLKLSIDQDIDNLVFKISYECYVKEFSAIITSSIVFKKTD